MFDYTRNNEDETKEMKTHTIWKLKDIKPKRNFNYKKHLSLASQTVTSHDLSVVDQNENHDCLDPVLGGQFQLVSLNSLWPRTTLIIGLQFLLL